MENFIPKRLGKKVLIMTGTLYFMGRVVGEDLMHIHLDECSWIANTGRYHQICKHGKPIKNETEVEPQPDGQITSVAKNGSHICDWLFPLWRDPV